MKRKVKLRVSEAMKQAGVTSIKAAVKLGPALRKEPSSAPAPAAQKSFGFDFTHGFLGEEFLLWLWFQWETKGGEIDVPGRGQIGVAIDDLLVFAPTGEDDTKQTLRGGSPTRAPEALAALRAGHRVGKAKLIVADAQRSWTVTIDGARMSFGGAKLPADAEDCESSEDRSVDRAANWLALFETVAALFHRFLEVRVSPAWLKTEAPAIAAWMRR